MAHTLLKSMAKSTGAMNGGVSLAGYKTIPTIQGWGNSNHTPAANIVPMDSEPGRDPSPKQDGNNKPMFSASRLITSSVACVNPYAFDGGYEIQHVPVQTEGEQVTITKEPAWRVYGLHKNDYDMAFTVANLLTQASSSCAVQELVNGFKNANRCVIGVYDTKEEASEAIRKIGISMATNDVGAILI